MTANSTPEPLESLYSPDYPRSPKWPTLSERLVAALIFGAAESSARPVPAPDEVQKRLKAIVKAIWGQTVSGRPTEDDLFEIAELFGDTQGDRLEREGLRADGFDELRATIPEPESLRRIAERAHPNQMDGALPFEKTADSYRLRRKYRKYEPYLATCAMGHTNVEEYEMHRALTAIADLLRPFGISMQTDPLTLGMIALARHRTPLK